jgi:hypothetical protein
MPYKDTIKEKERTLKRKDYFRERYHRLRDMGLWKYEYKPNGTSMGYRGEIFANKLLVGSKRVYRPSDLFWEGKLVEVKTSSLIRTKSRNFGWKFLLTRQLHKVDLFLLICKDESGKVQYVLLIPDKDIEVKNLTISKSGITKFSKYLLTF